MHAAPMARDKLFNMRMSEEEWARLEGLAGHYGLNAAGLIRMLLKREADAVLLDDETKRAVAETRAKRKVKR